MPGLVLPGLVSPLGGSGLGVVPGSGATATITGYNPTTGVVSGTAPPGLLVVVSVAGAYAANTIAGASGAWSVALTGAGGKKLSAAAVPVGTFLAAINLTSTWNPNDAASGLVFSNGNLTVKPPAGSTATYYNARGTNSRSSGKYYFEVTCIGAGTGTINFAAGLAGASNSLTSSYSSADCTVIGDNRGTYDNGVYTNGSGTNFTANTVVGIAANIDNGSINFYINGTAINSNDTITDNVVFPFIVNRQGGSGGILNVGTSAFAYTPPSGYSAWG